jgi:lipoprotein-anchoring transpeptidase ErfK/SrfK
MKYASCGRRRRRPRAAAATLVALVGIKAGAVGEPASAALTPGGDDPTVPSRSSAIAAVEPGHTLTLHVAPDGPAVGRIGARTRFGSPTRLPVVAGRGRWLAVSTEALGNGRLGWIRRSAPMRLLRTRYQIVISLSGRRLELRDGARTLLRAAVAVGSASSPTPTGRFGITDKLAGGRYGRYYGCCVLAISAIQPHLPRGWHGGNRVALHGTATPSSIGQASSAGCVRMDDSSLRALMRRLALGTPVTIRPY